VKVYRNQILLIKRIFFHHDHIADIPRLEFEGPVANMVAGSRPPGSPLVGTPERTNGGRVHRIPRTVVDEGQEIGRGGFQAHLEGERINRFKTDTVKVAQLALVVSLGIFHDVEHIGVLGPETRR